MSLTQFVNKLGSSSNNNIEQCGNKDNQGTKDDTLLEPVIPVENEELTLKVLNEHMRNNHKEVMQELANIKNECSFGDKASKSENTFKKPMENHEHYVLEKTKMLRESLAACPEFVFCKRTEYFILQHMHRKGRL